MKKLLTLAAASVALTAASPSLAQTNANFVGPRVELTAGVDDLTNTIDRSDVNYGAAVGLDLPVGDRVTLGVEANTSNVFNDDLTIGVGIRAGYALNRNLLAYAGVGYENAELFDINQLRERNFDGVRVSGGLEFALNRNLYSKIEYRYSDLENTGRHSGLVGVGLRF